MALEDLPYNELRDKAFTLAESRHDIPFFLDLYNHTSAMNNASAEGGSLGDISGTLIDIVTGAREVFTEEYVGELEPLFIARFATYLREHGVNE